MIRACLLGVLLSSFTLLWAQNPTVVNGVATYHSDKTIGSQFLVPDSWDKIVIKANVTLTGSFYMPNRTRAIEIMGENWNTSVIQGTGATQWHAQGDKQARQHSAIRCDKSPDVYIHDLKSLNPDKFHISAGFGFVDVEHCRLIDNRGRHTTDGVHGGRQKTTVKDCYIDTHDDALYLSECTLVENTTIVHNKNGSPLQVSWGYDDFDGHTCVVKNVTVIDAYNGSDYNQGVVSWASRNGTGPRTINVDFQGSFTRQTQSGAQQSHMYQIGRRTGGFPDGTINVTGLCNWQNSVIIYDNTNSQVVINGCGGNGGSGAPIGATIALQARVNGKYVWMQQSSGNQLIAQGPGTANNDKRYIVVDAGNGLVALQSKKNNNYVTATNAGAGILKANAGSIGSWEKFEWVENGDGSVSLRAQVNGKLVTAENAGNNPLIANRNNVGLWEKFDVLVISGAREEVQETATSLRVYPNPASDLLLVDGLLEKQVMSITNLLGAEVMQVETSGKIEVESLPSGIYLLRVENQAPMRFVKR